jgi:uncharacterized protein YcbX
VADSPIVDDLWLYPVKAMRGYARDTVDVAIWGFEHDRRWMVVQPDGTFLTQRALPIMARVGAHAGPGGLILSSDDAPAMTVPIPKASAERRQVMVWSDPVPALDAGPDAAAWLSDRLGLPCGLVYMDDMDVRPVDPAFGAPGDRAAFSDGFPVLLTNLASLDALNQELDHPIGMTRFRPNIVVSGLSAWEEDRWKRIRIGDVTFRVAKPCARCAVTTVDQTTGERPDKTEPLRALGRIRRAQDGVMFGQNLIPDGPGRIAIGDRITVLEAGESNLRPIPPKDVG